MQSETEPCLKDAILLLTLLFISCRLSPAGNPKMTEFSADSPRSFPDFDPVAGQWLSYQ